MVTSCGTCGARKNIVSVIEDGGKGVVASQIVEALMIAWLIEPKGHGRLSERAILRWETGLVVAYQLDVHSGRS